MKTGAWLQALLLAVTGVALLVLPHVVDNYVIYIGARLFVYILVALGLNLLTGYAGQVSLGHAAFYALGAYTAAILAESLHWPFMICVLAAALFTALVGYVLGLPCLRLSGLYLAMATLGFTLIVQEMLLQLAAITHGSEGMSVPTASILGFALDSDYRKYSLLLGVTTAMLILARNLVRGRTGRAFLAIRENERAAEAMGVNLAQYKTIAFAISALYTGLAGALSAFLIILPELLAGLDVWQALVYGVIMVLTILFMPFGFSGAIRRYAYRWFGIGVEPIIPRRLGH